MKSTITIFAFCILGLTVCSCRCDFEEDEAKNRNPEHVQKNEKIK